MSKSRYGLRDSHDQTMTNTHSMIFTYLLLGAGVPEDPQGVPLVLSFSDLNSDGVFGISVT